jgi:two-component system, OmpR family, sensor kinase
MSLRNRLLITFTLVVFVSLFITAVIVSILVQGTRDKNALSRLESQALPISIQFRQLVSGQATLSEVYASLQEQAQENNVYIILVNSDNDIVREISPDIGSQINISPEQLPSGVTQAVSGTFKTTSNIRFIYVAYPVKGVSGVLLSQRFAALVLAMPRSGALSTLISLLTPFLWAAIISLVISTIIAIFLARSIYRPVQRLTTAVENITQGNYDQSIPLEGPQELKELAVGFNNMSSQVRESQQQLRHFVADVSHQLKSPLTSIQGFGQAMLDGTAGDEATREKASRIIVDESKRMLRQVNELLELSRMQSGQVQMKKEQVDVEEIIVRCREIFDSKIQEKKLHLMTNLENLSPVIGDADRLEDVFCNLLDNAIKNTPAYGEVHITANKRNRAVEISITDTGPGISQEQIPFLFKRFQKGTDLHSGTGLGLAIAREIVLAHGGSIKVTSNPGEGAKFTVTLPAETK